jgi:hypothetical protein
MALGIGPILSKRGGKEEMKGTMRKLIRGRRKYNGDEPGRGS